MNECMVNKGTSSTSSSSSSSSSSSQGLTKITWKNGCDFER